MESSTQLKKGIAITFVAKYSNIFIQLIINSVLARLLLPEEFGVVAIITVFITFFTILGDMGFGPAIIQDKSLEDREISDIYKFSIIASVVLGIIFCIFSYFIAIFYSNRIYIKLGYILAIAVIFNVLKIVPTAIMNKNKEFKKVGIINVSSNIIIGCVTIFLAYRGFSYYALVMDSVLKSIVIFILSVKLSGMKIYKGFNVAPVKKIKTYAGYQFSFNFVNYFTRNLDNILAGKFLGASALGYYDKAYKLMLYPVQNLTHVITPVLHPILSEYQDNKDVIYREYMKVVNVLADIGVFVSIFCYFSAYEIINIMYGPNWNNTIPVFKMLAISIVLQMILSSIGSIFQATGHVDKLFQTGVVSAVFSLSAIIIGIVIGDIKTLATGVVISFVFNFVQNYYVLITNVFGKSFKDFIVNFKNIVIIALIMITGYVIIPEISVNNIFISVSIKMIIGIVLYIIGLLVTKEYKNILKIVIKK